MQPSPSSPWWKNCRWTLALCAAMAVANLGLFPAAPDAFGRWIHWLQFDRQAIAQGELWRLVTGNLVHWSVEHFLLDCGVFFVVGWLYERHLGRSYAWILLASGLAVGCGIFVFLPEMEIYRGLSGVDSGQFAAAVGIEFHLARRQPRRWVWVAPAAAIFVLKILYECASGQMFFGTESLGNIGLPTPLAHAAGALAAAIVLAAPYATLPPFRPCHRRVHASLPDAHRPWRLRAHSILRLPGPSLSKTPTQALPATAGSPRCPGACSPR